MFSQTTEYALRAMACLAYQPTELVPTPELAQTTRVPSNYLSKVLQILAGADLIVGRRGVGGGYRLARPPQDIRLLDVINAVEPVNRIKACPLGIPSHGTQLCPLHQRIDRANALVIEAYGSTTLADIVGDASSPRRPLCDSTSTTPLSMSVRSKRA